MDLKRRVPIPKAVMPMLLAMPLLASGCGGGGKVIDAWCVDTLVLDGVRLSNSNGSLLAVLCPGSVDLSPEDVVVSAAPAAEAPDEETDDRPVEAEDEGTGVYGPSSRRSTMRGDDEQPAEWETAAVIGQKRGLSSRVLILVALSESAVDEIDDTGLEVCINGGTSRSFREVEQAAELEIKSLFGEVVVENDVEEDTRMISEPRFGPP